MSNEPTKSCETGKCSIARTIWIVLLVIAAGAVVTFIYRQKPDSAASLGERTGVAIDRAVEKTADAAEGTIDATKNAASKAVEKTGEALENAGEAVEKTGADIRK
jgi:hypothetical protein